MYKGDPDFLKLGMLNICVNSALQWRPNSSIPT